MWHALYVCLWCEIFKSGSHIAKLQEFTAKLSSFAVAVVVTTTIVKIINFCTSTVNLWLATGFKSYPGTCGIDLSLYHSASANEIEFWFKSVPCSLVGCS